VKTGIDQKTHQSTSANQADSAPDTASTPHPPPSANGLRGD
jgi:hypothetical protein